MTISSSPTTPVAGEAVTLTSSLDTSPLADATVLELTSVPSASALSLGYVVGNDVLSTASTSAVAIAENGSSSFTPDVAGEYGVRIYLYYREAGASTIPGDAANSTNERWRLRASEASTINVGAYADLPITPERGGGAVLRLTIVGSTVTAAELRDFVDEPSRIAAEDSTTAAALAAIASTAVSTAIGTFITRVTDLRDELEDHIPNTDTWHSGEVTEAVPTLSTPTTTDAAIATLNELHEVMIGHVEVETRHTSTDHASIPIVAKARTLAQATVLLADLRERCYERHRVKGSGSSPAVHVNAGGDTTNTLSAPTKLDDIIVAYLDALVTADPSVVAGESEGLFDAAHLGGFTIAEVA